MVPRMPPISLAAIYIRGCYVAAARSPLLLSGAATYEPISQEISEATAQNESVGYRRGYCLFLIWHDFKTRHHDIRSQSHDSDDKDRIIGDYRRLHGLYIFDYFLFRLSL